MSDWLELSRGYDRNEVLYAAQARLDAYGLKLLDLPDEAVKVNVGRELGRRTVFQVLVERSVLGA
jgi:hypothetical protein